jgi:glycosyltransferase involved in cell wall biosynthesis
MSDVSIVIPVYNEIKFIQKTLESVVDEADEVIISDNASTDGTSDICRNFANKYPEINYIRHNENKGAMFNLNYCTNKSTRKYTRIVGGHDIISKGSTGHLCKLLDDNPDAVMAYSKYCIELNDDYTYNNFLYMYQNWIQKLSSDSPFDRVEGMTSIHCYIYYSVYKTELLKQASIPKIARNYTTDIGMMSNLASMGKFITDELSVYYWMNPRPREDFLKESMRTSKTITNNKIQEPFFWQFIIACEQYDLAKQMQKVDSAPEDFLVKIKNNKLLEYSSLPVPEQPDIILSEIQDEKLEVAKELYHIFFEQSKKIEGLKKIEELKKTKELKKAKFNNNIVIKMIKYLMPYGAYKLYQLLKASPRKV